MDFWDRDFKDIFDKARDRYRQDERDDLQREIVGLGDARIKRFLPHGSDTARSIRDKQDRDELTALQMLLLSSASYAALYADTWELLEDAEKETAKVIAQAEKDFDALMDKAVRLPNGRAVFLDDSGDAVTEDGKVIDPAIAAAIEWTVDAPTYREYIEHRQRINDLREYQVEVLGHARERLSDHKNPLEHQGVEAIYKDIDGGLKDLVRVEPLNASVAESRHSNTADIEVPKFGN